MNKFILVRRLPDKEIKAHTMAFDTINAAAQEVVDFLARVGVASCSDAQRFGRAFAVQPIGTIWGHPSGYDFRILIADFTADGVPITPGMRVFNYYDRVWGIVTPEQFMSQSLLAPGGRHFNHWYDVACDSDGHMMTLNGERLATKEN